jgi:hypothetical protein
MLKRPCFVCGTPVRASMCDTCLALRPPQQRRQPANRPSRQARGYDAEYDQNRRAMVRHTRETGRPCVICGQPFGLEEMITAEHLVPKRLGGGNDLGNLAPAHFQVQLSLAQTTQIALPGPQIHGDGLKAPGWGDRVGPEFTGLTGALRAAILACRSATSFRQ